jgi:hypothetical protein
MAKVLLTYCAKPNMAGIGDLFGEENGNILSAFSTKKLPFTFQQSTFFQKFCQTKHCSSFYYFFLI